MKAIGGGRMSIQLRNQYLEEDNARLRRDVKGVAARLFDANERWRQQEQDIARLKELLATAEIRLRAGGA